MAQLPIIQFPFFKPENPIKMIQIIFALLLFSISSPCLAAETTSDMVLIPAGKSQMGSRNSLLELKPHDLFNTDRHTLGPENPAHEVYLDAYYMDKLEVANEKYKSFVDATGAKTPRGWEKTSFSGDRQPVVGISWKEAVAYCKWREKRLPTEAEWEKAGRGKHPVKYPWGNSPPDSEKLNYNEEIKKTTPVGSYEKGKSDFGIYDLSGNVSEWVQDWHYPEYYLFSPKENPQGPEKGQYKVIRGGNWRNNVDYVDLTYRNATAPNVRNYTVGFRCAKSVAK
jgi:formylglycine-generating enzyme required for sulfatase activity